MHPRVRLWLSLAAIAVVAAVALGWWQWREHVPALVATPPLDRLLVLPIAHPGGSDATIAGLSAHLRDALAAIPGYAVVDRERTGQAMRQLDPDGNAAIDIDALQQAAAATRVLQPTLVAEAGRWRLQARLYVRGTPIQALPGPLAGDPVAALQAWTTRPGTRQALQLGTQAIDLALPRPIAALDDYGAGLRAQQRGELAQSLRKLGDATRLAPGYAAAWLAQAGTALMIGEQDKAADAVEQGQRAAAAAPESLRRRLAAQRALIEGDPNAAVAQWRAQLAATPDDTDAELELARARGAGGDFTAAVATLQRLTQRDGNDPRAWFELGKFSILSGDAQRAVDDYLVRALVQFKRSRDLYGQAETVNALGIGYGRLGQTADATEQYRKAVELRHAVGNRRGEATSLRNLSSALAMTGKFEEAATYLGQARALHAELGDREGLAAVENESGLLAEERGNYPQALQAFRRALKAWQDVDDPFGIAQAQNDIGFAHYELGNYNDAQVYLQQAAGAYAKLGDHTGQVRTEQDLGLLAIARGRWSEARQRLQQSLASAEGQQMPEEAAVSRRHLAELELQQGHLSAAIEQARKAGASFRQREDPRGASDAGLLHVDALLAAHADAAARTALDALAPELAESSSEQRAIALVLRAELARRHGDEPATTLALQQARQLAAASGIRQLQLRIELARARIGQASGELDDATATLGNAGLRLQWLQLAMQRMLAAQQPARALAAYKEAADLLRAGDCLYAPTLHALGATAYAASGDPAGASAARARAGDARAVLRSDLPAGLRAGFDAAIARESAP
jgi:tetratricopeptide (TPR) repeat protein